MNVDNINHRLQWVDIAKGIGILLVIWAHCGGGLKYEWIYSFHMPLFFILSGFLFNYSSDFVSFVRKKAKRLLIPYFSFSLIIVVFSCIFDRLSLQEVFHLIIRLVIQKRQFTLWFLTCLFLVNLLFYFFHRLFHSLFRVGLACFISFIVGYIYTITLKSALPWNADAALIAVFFFYFGYCLKIKWPLIRNTCFSKDVAGMVLVASCAVFLSLFFLEYFLFGKTFEMFHSEYGFLPLTFMIALTGSFCVIQISLFLHCPFLEWIGKNSLVPFALHQSVLYPIAYRILNLFGWQILQESSLLSQLLFQTLVVALILIFSSMLIFLFSKTKLRVLIGLS